MVEDQDHLPIYSGPQLPISSIRADSCGMDGPHAPDEVFNKPPHHLSSAPVVIDLDIKSDTSDDDGVETGRLHHQEPMTPPSQLFWSHVISKLHLHVH